MVMILFKTLVALLVLVCFVHPIFSSFGFWYFGHFSCVIFFPFFFCLGHLALQNVNKDYVIFLYFVTLLTKVTKNEKFPKSHFFCKSALLMQPKEVHQKYIMRFKEEKKLFWSIFLFAKYQSVFKFDIKLHLIQKFCVLESIYR